MGSFAFSDEMARIASSSFPSSDNDDEGSIESDADHILIERDLIPTICFIFFFPPQDKPFKSFSMQMRLFMVSVIPRAGIFLPKLLLDSKEFASELRECKGGC
ncbi:hypothetical protein IMY05_006G0000500 [Salix suchowensis]|nr:hypothetical protein IMY05_006G0000500 [Salix suchowensis]